MGWPAEAGGNLQSTSHTWPDPHPSQARPTKVRPINWRVSPGLFIKQDEADLFALLNNSKRVLVCVCVCVYIYIYISNDIKLKCQKH